MNRRFNVFYEKKNNISKPKTSKKKMVLLNNDAYMNITKHLEEIHKLTHLETTIEHKISFVSKGFI